MSPSDRQAAARAVAKNQARHRLTKARFGFSEDQWPFVLVLVGNWLFSAVWFLGLKLFISWQPDLWNGYGDRLALVIKCAVFAILPGVIGVAIVAAQRLNPEMWVGQKVRPNSSLDINTRFILNTFEQFLLFTIGLAGLAVYAPIEEARSLIILTALFLLGRLLFWIGYHTNPLLRAFGFGITFYPTVAVYTWLLLYMVFGVYVPI
jgi:hypothetical protein